MGHNAMKGESDWADFLSDGLHLSAAGNAFVAKLLLQHIEVMCPSLHVVCCKFTSNAGNSGSSSLLQHHASWHDKLDASGADRVTSQKQSSTKWWSRLALCCST